MARTSKEVETPKIGEGYEYEVTRIRDKGGKLRHSRGNGDAIANAMLVFKANGGSLDSIISANKLTDKMAPHAVKPEGLRRMTLGVMLRKLVRDGTPVKIGKHVIGSLVQNVDLPDVELKSPTLAKRGDKTTTPAKKERASAKKPAKPRRARKSDEAEAA